MRLSLCRELRLQFRLERELATCRTELMFKIGEAARSFRISKNLSLREVARRMDISAPYLQDLETGKRGWSEGRIKQFKQAVAQKKGDQAE